MPSDDKLRDSEEQLRLATEAAEVGLWDWDVATDTLYWPPRVKAMFGISPDVPVTMADYYSGLHPDDRAATLDALADALDVDRKATYDVEYRTIGKEDGVIRWVAAKGKAIFDGGRCARVIGTAIDITAATPYTRPWGDSLEHPTRHRGLQEVIPTVCGATVPDTTATRGESHVNSHPRLDNWRPVRGPAHSIVQLQGPECHGRTSDAALATIGVGGRFIRSRAAHDSACEA